ncbi:MAG: beta strand repeat-containing protein [Candidatus Kariarchaeaceae archaeon]
MKYLLKQGLLAVLLVTLVVANFPLNIPMVQAADTTPPVVTINTPGNNSIFELGVDITYTYSVVEINPTTEEVLLNSNPIPDTGIITGLGTGTYNLTIVSTDNSSNVGWDQIIFLVADTITPVVTIDTPANASIFELGANIAYTYTVDDLSSTSVVIRRNGIIVSDTGLFIGLSVGVYTLNIEATDAHSNVGSDEIVFFVQDTTAPLVTITSPSNASTFEYGADIAYTYTATDLSGTTATILLDGGSVPDTGLLSTPDIGTHNLTIEVIDDYNNLDSDQITFFVQDSVSPVVTVTSPANNSIHELGTDIAYTYTVDDQSATTVVVKLNGIPISDTGLLTGLSVGTYTLRIEANDSYNILGFDEIYFSVADTTAPVVSINSPNNDTYFELGSTVVYTYTTNDLSSLSVVVKLNGVPITDSGSITGLAVGIYTLTVEATDVYSNVGFDEVIFFIEDSVSPVVTIDSPINATIFEFGGDVAYTYTVTDLSSTTVVVKLDGTPITDSGLITGLAVSTYTLTVEATDSFSNFGSDEIIFFVQDTTSPVVTITSPPNASIFELGLDVSYTYTVSDLSGTSVVVKLNGAPITDSGSISGLAVGTYTLTIEVTDIYSNVGFDEIVFFIEDSTSPIVSITSPGNDSTFEFGIDISYSYTISDLSGTSVVVRLNGAPIADSGSLSGLTVGTYTLTIEATDTSNNFGSDEITFFVQDSTAPVVTITSPSNDSFFELGVDVTYTYSVTDLSGTSVEVKIDGVPIPDSGSIVGLAVGTYTLTIEATDSFSNFGSDEIVFFVQDTTLPVVVITSPANASVFEFGSDISYTYTVTDLSSTTVVVKLDGTPIADTGLISGLTVGTYTLTVEATDAYGNVGTAETIFFYLVDTIPPVVTIVAPTNASTFEYGDDVSYSYTISDLSGTTVVVKLDGTPIADSGLLSGLAVGTYTLTVEATDTYSNFGFDEIIFFIQDTIAPVVVVTSPTNASVFEFGIDVGYTYTVTDLSGTTVLVKLNDAPIADTGLISGLAVGTYTLTIEATDVNSNFGSDEIIFFVQDSTAPVVSITSPNNATLFEFDSIVPYTYDVSDLSGTTVVVKLDGVPITDSGLLSGLAVGTYTLTVEATDSFSNFGFDEIVFFIQDTTSPVVAITSPANASVFEFGIDVGYTYTITDLSGTTVVVRLNGAPIPDTGLLSGLAVGSYVLNVEAIDTYNNIGFDEIIFDIQDSTAPTVTITSPSNDSFHEFGTDVPYTYTVDDLSGTSVVVRLNGVSITDSGLITGLTVGTYTLTIEATDTYSNVGSDEILFFIQDTTSPIVVITSPVNASTFEFGTDVSYTYTISDLSGTTMVVKLDSTPITDSGLITGLAVGMYTLTVEATDLYSNFGSDEIIFIVQDTTLPIVVITSPANASTFEFGNDVTYTYTVTDLSSTSVVVRLNGAPIADTGVISGLSVGTYTLVVEATDVYGNVGVAETIFFYLVDTIPPIVTITTPTNSSFFEFDSDVSYTYTVSDLSGTTVEVKLNGAPVPDIGILSGLPVGTYTLTVEATDTYSNFGFDEIIFFIQDTTSPVVVVTSPSNASVFEFGIDVSYAYTVTDLSGTTVTVRLNGSPIPDSGLLSGLTVGIYYLNVEATDAYSNVGSDEIVFYVQDSTAPVVVITSPANDSSHEFGLDVTYTYTLSDLSSTTVIVKLDGTPITDTGLLSSLAVGTYLLTVEATDIYSNFGFDEITFFVQDTTLPVVTITSPANASTFEFGTDVAYTYTVTDLSSTSVIVILNGAQIADTGLISGLSVGTYTLVVEATDAYGNVGVAETVFFYLVDTISPVVSITSPVNSSTFEFGSDISYTYTITDLSATSETIRLNGAPIPDVGVLSGLPVGTYVLSVESIDTHGNQGTDEVIIYIQDTTAPEVTIANPINASTFEFGSGIPYTYSVLDLSGTTVGVKLNGAPIPDSGVISGLMVGTYILRVEANDDYGNYAFDEITLFVVDTTAPIVTIDSPSNSSTFEFGSDITYTYTVTDLSGTTVVVKLNGASIPDIGILSSLAVGTYDLTIEATDSSSNFNSEEITFFIVDTTAPIVNINTPTNASSHEFGDDVPFTYTVSDLSGTTVELELNGVSIPDNGLLSGLAVGTYTLFIQATDVYGNVGSDSIVFFVTDTIIPVVTITSPVNASIFEFGSDVTYTYTVDDLSGTTVVVSLNSAPIPDSGLLTGLTVGTYTLNVEATDDHGNSGSAETTFFFMVDTTAPAVSISAPVNATTFEFGDDVPYSYTVFDLSGTTIEVRLNGAPIPDSGVITSLLVGTYVLTVEATDTYGNVGSDEIIFDIQDTINPVVSLTSPSNASIFEFGSDVSYFYTVTDLSSTTVVIRLNGAPIPDSGLLTSLAVGTYVLNIEATDAHSNIGFAEITFFVVDTTDPVVVIIDPLNASVHEFGDDVSFAYTIDDLSGTTIVVRLNGAPIPDTGVLSGLSVGTYTLNVEATDTSNNIGVDEITFFVEDTTNPIVSITAPLNASTPEFGLDVPYSYSVFDLSGTSIVVELNSVVVSDSGLLTSLAVGTYILNVEATDIYGNVGFAEITFFVKDTTNPVVVITTPVNASIFEFGDDVSYTYTVDDLSGTSIEVSLNTASIPDTGLLIGLPVGTYTLNVVATDIYGNVGLAETTFFFLVDTTAPVVEITSPANASFFEFGSDVDYTYTIGFESNICDCST